jgi:hypothetical protein
MHARIAIEAGYRYGARLPDTVYASLYFADQHWKAPNRARYMAALAEHRPAMATVLDWEEEGQLTTVLDWAEEAAQHVTESVLLIPKVIGGVPRLPRSIGDKRVVLAYSVPTQYGGSAVPLWQFAGWPVHLLGGSPQTQKRAWGRLKHIAEVVSIDGNMHKKMATGRCCYWTLKKTRHGHWQPLNRAVEHDAPDEAFRRSCRNIASAWDHWAADTQSMPLFT